ncbi:MAG: hypothetical protein WDN50_01190 [Bradyrhizobium sp.]
MTKPRVLISDALSPAAVQIFKDRGVEVDFQPNLARTRTSSPRSSAIMTALRSVRARKPPPRSSRGQRG